MQVNEKLIRLFLDRNFVFVSINYRLFLREDKEKVSVYNQAEDIASAVAWIHNRASEFNIDPAQTYLYGHSAGAHLVSLVGTDSKYLINSGVDRANIKGVIASDVHAYHVPKAISLMKNHPRLVKEVPGIIGIFGADTATQLKGSPMNFKSF